MLRFATRLLSRDPNSDQELLLHLWTLQVSSWNLRPSPKFHSLCSQSRYCFKVLGQTVKNKDWRSQVIPAPVTDRFPFVIASSLMTSPGPRWSRRTNPSSLMKPQLQILLFVSSEKLSLGSDCGACTLSAVAWTKLPQPPRNGPRCTSSILTHSNHFLTQG